MKKVCTTLILVLLGFTFLISFAKAAVNFDSSSANADGTPGTSVTWTHTVNTTGTSLWVGGGSPTITGATFNSVAMTEVHDIAADDRWVSFYLASSSIGALSVTVNFSNSDNYTGVAISVNGSAITADVQGATATSTCGGCTSISRELTTTNSDSLNVDTVIMTGAWTAGSESATGTNQTNQVSCELFGGDLANHGSTQTTTSAGNYTMSWSWTGSTPIRYSVMEFRTGAPAPAAGGEIRHSRRFIITF